MPRNLMNSLAPKADREMPEPTLRLVLQDYKRFRKIKAETLDKYESMLLRCLPDWFDRNLNEIRKDEILDRHEMLSRRNGPRGSGSAEADAVFRVFRAIYRFAEGRYEDEFLEPVVRRNPVNVLNACRAWNKSRRRVTMIPKHKMKAWFKAVQAYRNDSIRDYLTFIYLTGCRRSEAAALQWSWIDLDIGVVNLPGDAVKNSCDFSLPLSGYLWFMLKARKNRPDADPVWVFPGGKKGHHISNHLKITDKIFAKTGINWSVHDLRRGYATIANSCVHSDLILKRLLNHKVDGRDVTAGYVISDVDSLRKPVEAIAAKILEYSGYKFVPYFGLVEIENSAQAESLIHEDALLAALRRLNAETLQEMTNSNVVSISRGR